MYGHIGSRVVEGDGVKVARIDTSSVDGNRATMRWAWAVARIDGTADAFVEEHPTGLFTVADFAEVFATAGPQAEFDPKGLLDRGLHIAVR